MPARFLLVILLFVALGSGFATANAGAQAPSPTGPYAPLNRPGPPVTISDSALRASLACSLDLRHSTRNPILLVTGTYLDPGPTFSWNYERAFDARGWPFCTISLQYHSTGDSQVAGEYLVAALRLISSESHRPVDVLSFSQGGMVTRWALRFWPDTRLLVHDLVGLDPNNHGSLNSQVFCLAPCQPAQWQQSPSAHFYQALNSGAETFAGIDYTVIYTHADEVVVPNVDGSSVATCSSCLFTGGGRIANIAVQSVCVADMSDHLAMGTYDAVGFALAIDALVHDGTADPRRIQKSVCAEVFQPGVDPTTFPADYARFLAGGANAILTAPTVASEPPLACYVYASPPPRCLTPHPQP